MKRILLLAITLLTVACVRSASKPAIWPGATTPTGQATSSTPSPTVLPTLDSLRPSSTSPTSPFSWCPATPISLTEPHLRVAYVAEGDVWLWDEGENPARLTHSGDTRDVTISSDGQVIGYTRGVGAGRVELWAMGSDGRNPRLLLSTDEFTAMQPGANVKSVVSNDMVFVPGSDTVAFNSYPLLDSEKVWIYEPTDLWLVDADTGQRRNLQPGGYFVFSPNGEWVAVLNTTGLSLMKSDGSGLRKDILSTYEKIVEGEGYYYPQPFWLADSSALAVAVPDSDEMYTPEATFTVWRVPIENGTPARLGTFRGFSPSVQFSPDGKLLTYWQLVKARSDLRDIHLASLDSKQDIVYATGKLATNLAWSPDGQEFLYSLGQEGELSLGKACDPSGDLSNITGQVNDIDWIDARGYWYETGISNARVLHIVWFDQPRKPVVLGPLSAYAWAGR